MRMADMVQGEEYLLSNGSLGAFQSGGKYQRVRFIGKNSAGKAVVEVLSDIALIDQKWAGRKSQVGMVKPVSCGRLQPVPREVAA